jgi:hypothetical protein
MIIKPRKDQTIFDMAVQLYGSVDYVYKILADNPGLENIHPTNLVGYNLVYSLSNDADVLYFVKKQISITTGLPVLSTGYSFDDSFALSFD